jgi:hypothetical protein
MEAKLCSFVQLPANSSFISLNNFLCNLFHIVIAN